MSYWCPFCREVFVSDDNGTSLGKVNEHINSEHDPETPADRRYDAP
jgi:hypothetical protein